MVDLVTINAIILTVVLFLYGATWQTETKVDFIFAISLIAVGGFMAAFLGLIKLGGLKSEQYRSKITVWLFICLGVVFVLNWSTTWKEFGILEGSSLSLDQMSSTVLMGVAEDVFFRGFITAWLMVLVGPVLGSILGSGVFAIYHTNRYGHDLPSMMITFGAGLVLAWAMFNTKSLTSSVLAHVIINFVALGGFLMGGPIASLVVMVIVSVLLLYIMKPKRGGT